MSEEKTVHVLIRDFFGVVALAFTVFGFMALNSFSPTDPSFNKSVTGMNVTVVTTAGTDAEARALLGHLGMPFRT